MATKKQTGKLSQLMGTMAWVSVLALWLCVGCSWLHPEHLRFLGVVGLAFPFFVAGVVVMTLLCLLLARRKIWIPLLGLATCIIPLREYCPINMPSPAPKGAIKVMSYNTLAFGHNKKDAEGHNSVAKYIGRSGADIVCFQEGFYFTKVIFEEDVRKPSKGHLAYFDTIRSKDHIIGCFSHYPIVGKENLLPDSNAGCGVFLLRMGHNDTLRVVNCHLQSMRLSIEDRNNYHKIIENPEGADVEGSSRMLISKISRASVMRAYQADALAEYLAKNKGKNLLVCGDFNDTPVSYTHHQITQSGLTNVFTASGNGIGRTFNRDAIYVRIDHIFCSDHWKPFGCKIDRSVEHSDHYPIYTYLQRKKDTP